MSHKPLVSVIIIFLNAAPFIEEAIESVFAQTYPVWELLLVDDGSTDESTALAQSYVERHPDKVRYLEHQAHCNRGMSASRNLGIRHANGEYIAFLDADDVWLPSTLEEQVRLLNEYSDAGAVYGKVLYWYSWMRGQENSERDFTPEPGVAPNTLVRPPHLLSVFLHNEAATPSGMLIRRTVIEDVGGFEEGFGDMYEDQAFCAKLCLKVPLFVSGQCWYKYRQHTASSCAVAHKNGHYHAARQFFLTWLAGYLATQDIDDPGVWQALSTALWPYHHPHMYRLVKSIHWVTHLMLHLARRILPIPVRYWLSRFWQIRQSWPPVGWVRFGSLRRLAPVSRDWGFDRGLPIDRYYIERFLAAHAPDIQGHVLEIGDDAYTCRFGGDRVTRSDVLHIMESNPKVSILGDLTYAPHIPSNTFDCIILTQTLQLIYDARAALQTCQRILKPGGVLLLTVPGLSQITRYDMDRWGDYWRFTIASARRLFVEVFPVASIKVEAHGNVLAATAFLHGLATRELRQHELDYRDPDYEVLITVRAVKPEVTK